jgi:hypothetical protein
MKKPALLALAAACILFLIAVPQMALAGVPCVTREFKTTMMKDACTKGGQDEAKQVMKKFIITAKVKVPSITDCKSCHTALSPNYPRTPNALEQFLKAGGK